MKVNVLIFGSLIDVTGGNAEILVDNVSDCNSLKDLLHNKYPALNDYTYRMAVNQEMISGNHKLNDKDIIALLPPFAGG